VAFCPIPWSKFPIRSLVFTGRRPPEAPEIFVSANVPFNPYHLVVAAKGFSSYTQDVDVRSAVPTTLDISLKLGTTSDNITVEAGGADLVETESTPHTRRGPRTLRQVATREPVVFT